MAAKPRRATATEDIVPDPLILAAIERAEVHEGRALRGYVAAHLGYRHNSATTRWLGPRIAALEAAGQVVRRRSQGLVHWTLTEAGAGRLAAARRAREAGVLPESPQHREWRLARRVAGERVEEIRAAALAAVEEARQLLAGTETPSPETVERLRVDLDDRFRTLRTAACCVRAWPEPDERTRDPNRSLAWRDLRERCGVGESERETGADGREVP